MARRLADFLGRWTLRRQIAHDDGTGARFDGLARWTPVQDGALYVETGQLILPGAPPMQAERRYIWHDDLSVSFDDGRFFHAVPARGGTAEHWCDPDWYRVAYDFTDWPRFTATWAVRGPRKGYRMTSVYTREPG